MLCCAASKVLCKLFKFLFRRVLQCSTPETRKSLSSFKQLCMCLQSANKRAYSLGSEESGNFSTRAHSCRFSQSALARNVLFEQLEINFIADKFTRFQFQIMGACGRFSEKYELRAMIFVGAHEQTQFSNRSTSFCCQKENGKCCSAWGTSCVL